MGATFSPCYKFAPHSHSPSHTPPSPWFSHVSPSNTRSHKENKRQTRTITQHRRSDLRSHLCKLRCTDCTANRTKHPHVEEEITTCHSLTHSINQSLSLSLSILPIRIRDSRSDPLLAAQAAAAAAAASLVSEQGPYRTTGAKNAQVSELEPILALFRLGEVKQTQTHA